MGDGTYGAYPFMLEYFYAVFYDFFRLFLKNG